MKSTFRWTTALSGLGLVAASLLTAQGSFAKTPATVKAPAPAKSGATVTKHKVSRTQMTGTVVSQQGTMLTVVPVRGSKTATTVMVPSTAKITMGKKAMALSGLLKGDKVCVYMTDGKVTRVDHVGMAKTKAGSTMSATKK